MYFRLAWALLAAASARGQNTILFEDTFATPGLRLNTATWTTEIGAGSFLGRTQLTNWVTGNGQFAVNANGAQLRLDTFNPTGFSLFGTHAKTLASFRPGATSAIELTVRLQLTSLEPGLVYGVYFYGCPGPCATRHDEIDIELVTNFLQPGSPLRVQLNRYADEPLGPGHGRVLSLPAGFDPLAPHDWTIRWSLSRIDYLVDGVLLDSVSTILPEGPMQANVIVWGPDAAWADAYSGTLQAAATAGGNRTFAANVKSVRIRETAGATQGLRFVPVAPCRVADTRPGEGKSGAFGPPAMAAGSTRELPIALSGCAIPANAQAFSLNLTAVPAGGGLQYLTAWPSGQSRPLASTLNSFDGKVVANAAILPAGDGGAVSIFVTEAAHVIVDINGYFTP